MNKYFLLLLFIIFSTSLFAQSSFRLGFQGGVSNASIDQGGDLVGGPGLDMEDFSTIGLVVTRSWNEKWDMTSGLSYSAATHIVTPAPGLDLNKRFEEFSMVSIPVLASYSFLPFAFVTGGPIFDFQLGSSDYLSQSGIGYQLGLGGKYQVDRFRFAFIPNFKRHGAIQYESTSRKRNVTELGLNLEVTYQIR